MNDRLHLELRVNDMPYTVKAAPHRHNAETQYRVSADDAGEVLFIFDIEAGRYIPVGTAKGKFPDELATAIGNELISLHLHKRRA